MWLDLLDNQEIHRKCWSNDDAWSGVSVERKKVSLSTLIRLNRGQSVCGDKYDNEDILS